MIKLEFINEHGEIVETEYLSTSIDDPQGVNPELYEEAKSWISSNCVKN